MDSWKEIWQWTFQCPFIPQMGHGPEAGLGFRHEWAKWSSLPHLKQGPGGFLSLLVVGGLEPGRAVLKGGIWPDFVGPSLALPILPGY